MVEVSGRSRQSNAVLSCVELTGVRNSRNKRAHKELTVDGIEGRKVRHNRKAAYVRRKLAKSCRCEVEKCGRQGTKAVWRHKAETRMCQYVD